MNTLLIIYTSSFIINILCVLKMFNIDAENAGRTTWEEVVYTFKGGMLFGLDLAATILLMCLVPFYPICLLNRHKKGE